MSVIPRIAIGDWVFLDHAKQTEQLISPAILIRLVASGPEFERDERGHASKEIWMLDDGRAVDRMALRKLDLRSQIAAANELALRVARCAPVTQAEIDNAVVSAQRMMTLIESSYPLPATRKQDLRDGMYVWTELSEVVLARRRWLEHRLPALLRCVHIAGALTLATRQGQRIAADAIKASLRCAINGRPIAEYADEIKAFEVAMRIVDACTPIYPQEIA